METIKRVLDLVGARDASPPESRLERLLLACAAFLAALACAAVWGLAAGAGAGRFPIGNLAVVPILLVVSTAASLPVGLLAFRLLSKSGRGSDLLLAHASAVFAGCLMLVLLSPLVALYQLSSTWVGPTVAVGSVLLAFAGGLGVLMRTLKRLTTSVGLRPFAAPAVFLVLLQLLSLSQLASLAPPVMRSRTTFGHGIDGVLGAPAAEAAPAAPRALESADE
ncbi:MAG: hypothetical protein R3B36_26265 [Polyangiaceae bacterium]